LSGGVNGRPEKARVARESSVGSEVDLIARLVAQWYPTTIMRLSRVFLPVLLTAAWGTSLQAQQTPPPVVPHSEEMFKQLQQEAQSAPSSTSRKPVTGDASDPFARYPESEYLVATGHGDLTKGAARCEQVADIVARAELAKRIRVQIKEQATDRVRERSGQPLEQDIEIVREQLANELLQDVKIVARSTDQATNTCSSVAVMPKNKITAQPGLQPSPSP